MMCSDCLDRQATTAGLCPRCYQRKWRAGERGQRTRGDRWAETAPTHTEAADPSWMDHRACTDVDVDVFFPGRGEPVAPAKEICAGCPVTDDCLAYALDHRIIHGVWGGKAEHERRQMRRQRSQRPIRHGTPGGYKTHRRRGEDACDACRAANSNATAERKARQRQETTDA